MICLNCKGEDSRILCDLGAQPSGNLYPPSPDESLGATKFPLSYRYCLNCGLVQIEDVPVVSELFDSHNYLSGTSAPVVEHFRRLSNTLAADLSLMPGDLVIDIGSNDGTLLECFLALQCRVLGIDPGEYAKPIAERHGVTTLRSYWTKDLASILRGFEVQPRLITATSVFYHISDIDDFVSGLSLLCDEETHILIQYVSLEEMLRNFTFDHLYHEHTMMYSRASLINVFERRGFVHVSSELYPIHGGSFVSVFKRSNTPSLDVIPSLDHEMTQLFENFSKHVEQFKHHCHAILHKLVVEENKVIIGIGAPVKASTLVNYLGLTSRYFKCVLEVNHLKVGRYIPGTTIPILHEDEVSLDCDFLFIFSWNFKDYFIEKYKHFLSRGGGLIFPHPVPHIVRATGTEWLGQ